MDKNKMSLASFGYWRYIKLLGSGAFGEVHHWRNEDTGEEIATKRLKPNPKLRPDEIVTLHKRWLKEYEWMKKLTTEYMVGAIDMQDNEFMEYLKSRSHVQHCLPVIIMQYCNGGDLRHHLNKIENINGLNEYEGRSILHTLSNSIAYLHNECNIEHRDIKPENIVLHFEGNRRIYKLTDFGYARDIPDSTVAQSVVGTRSYVAPEVVESGSYTRSVDYWSAGHVVYETICGTLPFLPSENNFVKRIETIKSMPRYCLNIVYNIENPLNSDLKYGFHLPMNNCSPIFIRKIEDWLRLALDYNYRSRGRNAANELKFFTLVDEILSNNKILTVFSLKKYEKFYYDKQSIDRLHLEIFLKKLASDNDIDINNLFLITPPLHPKNEIVQPSDYFVEEWCDTSKEDSPPVMLYVGEFMKQTSAPIVIREYFNPYKLVWKCFGANPLDPDIPTWLIKEYEKEVHLLLTQQQDRLTCCINGLHGFTIELEKNLFYYEQKIGELNENLFTLKGNIQSFSTIVNDVIKPQNNPLSESSEARLNSFLIKLEELTKYIKNIKISYKPLFQRCRELAQPAYYKKIIDDDIFLLKAYRSFLTEENISQKRIEEAQRYAENCIVQFESFLNKKETIMSNIDCEVRAYNELRMLVFNMTAEINLVAEEVKNQTRSLVNSLNTSNAFSSTNSFNDASLGLNCDSMSLINDTLQLADMISEQCSLMDDSP